MEPARADEALAALCAACKTAAPAAGVRHHVLQVDGFALKFERHGEFVSWQVNRALPPTAGDADDADDAALRAALAGSAARELPASFVARLADAGAGRLLAATHVVLLKAPGAGHAPTPPLERGDVLGSGPSLLAAASDDWLTRCRAILGADAADDAAPVVGAWIGDARRGAVLTDLKLDGQGFTRFVVLDFGLPPDQAAREAQRLCEIEAYRMLAMLGFPVAQQEAARLAELERTLQSTVDAMANDDVRDDAQAFETLTRLAAEVEHGQARTRYRFPATRAYHTIVQQRLADLREQRIEGVQTLGGFLARRFAPAMALCDSTSTRLSDIAERIGRAVSLAQVRVEMHREAGNQQLLAALARRQKLQLRLQQTVEGLSVVAISYYALGLVGYLAKAAKASGLLEPLHVQPDVVVGIAVLPVAAAVTWFIRRLRAHLGEG
jgi:uncharacterized membrane-anchored protein